MAPDNFSNLVNGSSDYKFKFVVADDLPLVILSILIVFVNVFVILLFTFKQSLRSPSNYLLISLAVSDLLYGLIGIPLVLVCSTTPDCVSCIISYAFTRLTSISTVLHILAISYERYVKIVFPLEMPQVGRTSFELKIIASLWSVNLVFSLMPWCWTTFSQEACFKDEDESEMLKNKVFYIVHVIVFGLIPVLILLYTDISIFCVVRRQLDKIDKTSVGQRDSRKRIKKESKVVAIFGAMMVYFIICWSFYYAIQIVQAVGGEVMIPDWLFFTVILRYTTPLANPLLYTLLKHDFKRAICLEIKRIKDKRLPRHGELAAHYSTGDATACLTDLRILQAKERIAQ